MNTGHISYHRAHEETQRRQKENLTLQTSLLHIVPTLVRCGLQRFFVHLTEERHIRTASAAHYDLAFTITIDTNVNFLAFSKQHPRQPRWAVSGYTRVCPLDEPLLAGMVLEIRAIYEHPGFAAADVHLLLLARPHQNQKLLPCLPTFGPPLFFKFIPNSHATAWEIPQPKSHQLPVFHQFQYVQWLNFFLYQSLCPERNAPTTTGWRHWLHYLAPTWRVAGLSRRVAWGKRSRAKRVKASAMGR